MGAGGICWRGLPWGIVEATRRSGSDCGGGLCGPDLCSMPPCSGQSRPSPGGREDAASLDRPCARRLRDLAVGTDSPPFCKCFFALPSRFFSEVGHPDRSSMLAQPTARPSAECLAASSRMESRTAPVGQQGTSRARTAASAIGARRGARGSPLLTRGTVPRSPECAANSLRGSGPGESRSCVFLLHDGRVE